MTPEDTVRLVAKAEAHGWVPDEPTRAEWSHRFRRVDSIPVCERALDVLADTHDRRSMPTRAQWSGALRQAGWTATTTSDGWATEPDGSRRITEDGDEYHLLCRRWHGRRDACPARPADDPDPAPGRVPQVRAVRQIMGELMLGPEAHDHSEGAAGCPVCGLHDHPHDPATCARCADLGTVIADTLGEALNCEAAR